MGFAINSSIGSMDEEIDAAKEGKDILIGFNPRFLMDALKVIDEEEITMYMINPKAPCFIRDKEETYIYLILPVNFNVWYFNLINKMEEVFMENITIKDDFIKLGQALKLAGLVSSGIEAKIVVQDGEVKVNGETDTRRGRKLYAGDIFEYNGNKVTVSKA